MVCTFGLQETVWYGIVNWVHTTLFFFFLAKSILLYLHKNQATTRRKIRPNHLQLSIITMQTVAMIQSAYKPCMCTMQRANAPPNGSHLVQLPRPGHALTRTAQRDAVKAQSFFSKLRQDSASAGIIMLFDRVCDRRDRRHTHCVRITVSPRCVWQSGTRRVQ